MPMPMPGMSPEPYVGAAIWVLLTVAAVGAVALLVRKFIGLTRPPRSPQDQEAGPGAVTADQDDVPGGSQD